AWDVIKGMSSALSYAHAEKIIHSDFKPGNVFVTKKGVAKVFDFGIARAVAQVEHLDENTDDKTVFDAGNLGALTPAYASLEMLEGKEPDVRDDIYALGCVAYELFTGEHPYNKVPADEAERQGLKPKRITNIKKSQWRAIEKAIAFRRADRIASVDQFVDEISPNLKAANWLATGLAILLSIVISSYFLLFQEKKVDPYSEFDIRNELELKIKIDFYKEDLDSLIGNPRFTDRWQDAVWKDVSDLVILTEGGDPWVDDKKLVIYNLYLKQIVSAIGRHEYSRAEALVENAKRYSDNAAELEAHSREIAAARKLAKKTGQLQAARQQKDQQAQQARQKAAREQSKQKEAEKRFDAALANVNAQLKCQNRLNMRNFETAINKLRELDRARYSGMKNNIINSLASCITTMGKAFPERALEAKKSSLRLFNNNNAVLAGIKIHARDPCDKSLAGLGARGKRAVCKDKIKNIGAGPELVVIPGNNRMKAFAIGKYEVSINEFNKYCKSSASCTELKGHDGELPASAVSFNQVKNYLKWLSRQSGQKYRLPTKNEWVYAAKSKHQSLDANRNCKLSTRGIQKGEMLVRASIGKQNKWGLVNYVGNVQEWVYDQGRKLVAVGGSYAQSMENCNISTSHQHSGQADITTGFRVLRELSAES
ncbi:MAG: SUMF1/EgtB/PvdO family nonheme iron enzyme, partial [Gammaproteobacteria bacterium]|nr:SUMF1/EgtB/PvdO family nonheme iron enzyme [Gammaproteobacteria bacterium]